MIRFCDNFEIINDIKENSPYIVKIKSILKSYGLGCNFLQIWYQETELGEIISVISKLDRALVLYLTDKSDFNELIEFIDIIGYSSILLDNKYSYKFSNINFNTGKIMKLNKSINIIKNISIEKDISLKKVYLLLKECTSETFSVPEFEPFYLDMSHRVRHNTARCYGVVEDSRCIACAMTSSETYNNAILSAVAVAPDNRRKGLGKLIVENICFDLQLSNKDIYIYRQEKENIEFYKSIGFIDFGEWAEHRV